MWHERVGSLSGQDVNQGRECGTREWGHSLGKTLITGEDMERKSRSLSGQDVNHRRECGTRDWVTLWPAHKVTRVKQVIITIFSHCMTHIWSRSVVLQVQKRSCLQNTSFNKRNISYCKTVVGTYHL